MNKTYHFMSGLPRSGSTVLSAILNQNPDVYASPQTDLVSLLYTLESSIPELEGYKAGLLHQGFASVMHNMANTFYDHIDKPVIIDKNRGWGTPYNWDNLSPYVSAEGKVILTMRPILEVLASFVKVSRQSQKITKRQQYLNPNLWVSNYRNESDAVVDNLMMPNGEIDRALFSIANLLNNHKDRVHLVWFDDLLDRPQATMSSIYSFLELDNFDHNFSKIVAVDKHDDLAGYGVAGLHDVKKKLSRPKTDPANYLSDYSIQKYANCLDFLNLNPTN
jgi:sulfotransferase